MNGRFAFWRWFAGTRLGRRLWGGRWAPHTPAPWPHMPWPRTRWVPVTVCPRVAGADDDFFDCTLARCGCEVYGARAPDVVRMDGGPFRTTRDP